MSNTARNKIFAYLQIIRFPNLFTAAADILAGYFVMRSASIASSDLFLLILSSICIYGAGCVLNDLCDKEIDSRQRPFRPVPSGRISTREALALLVMLFGIGLFCAAQVGWVPLLIAAALCFLVVIYDIVAKNFDFYGPLTMAGCRSFNLLLGMSSGLSWGKATVFFPLITLVYVFSLTALSRFEVSGGIGSRKWEVLAGWCAVIMSLLGLWRAGVFSSSGLLLLAILIGWTGPSLLAAALKPVPEMVGKSVKALILGIPLLDAVYASSAQDLAYCLIIASMALAAVVLSRYVYVT
jgi:4-hydroxybenzoate polyprenyltransferase